KLRVIESVEHLKPKLQSATGIRAHRKVLEHRDVADVDARPPEIGPWPWGNVADIRKTELGIVKPCLRSPRRSLGFAGDQHSRGLGIRAGDSLTEVNARDADSHFSRDSGHELADARELPTVQDAIRKPMVSHPASNLRKLPK